MAARAFLLNFDAEQELAQMSSYRPTAAVQARSASLAKRLGSLIGADDVVISEATKPASLQAYRGVAWCPTPRALAQLRAAGAEIPATPPFSVLERVHDRRFGVELDQGPLPSHYVTSLEEALGVLGEGSATHEFLAKRSFSFAARGHRVLTSSLSAADRGFLRNSLRHGHGVVLEPRVKRLLDCSLHGLLEPSGTLHVGRPVIQLCDSKGVWLGVKPAASAELRLDEEDALIRTIERVAVALHQASYFGPFGMDAFRYQTADGKHAFRPLVEINARLTMGFSASGLACRL